MNLGSSRLLLLVCIILCFGRTAFAASENDTFGDGVVSNLRFDFECGPDPARASGAGGGISDWWEFVRQEHMDRRQRLARLAAQEGIEPPQLYDACIRDVDVGGQVIDLPLLRVVFSDRVFFDTAKAELRPEGGPLLQIVSESLRREPPDVILFVAGHTDARGSEEYNNNLSVRRADAVARQIVASGIGASQVWRVGFGEAMPIASNANETGRGVNRRVEFLIAATPDAIVRWIRSQTINACHFAETTALVDCLKIVPKQTSVTAVRVTEPVAPVALPTPTSVAIDPSVPETLVVPDKPAETVAEAESPGEIEVAAAHVEEIRIRLPDPIVVVDAPQR